MNLVRFGVSLPGELSQRFDALYRKKKYANRSEAIRDLIRHALVEEEIEGDALVIGVLNLLYDHHKRELQDKLTLFQHNHHDKFISTTHVHLDHDNCLEVILLKGQAREIKLIADQMIAITGVKHGQVYLTSTGKELR
jgi:CopG family nickel-responsive transcriptional regulator